MSVQNAGTAVCMDCAPNMFCLNDDSAAWAGYCVGKDPTLRWFNAGNGNLELQMDDRRVSQFTDYQCIDCNGEEYTAGSCAFVSDYFPDHGRTSWTDNSPLIAMVAKCPFQAQTRTMQRYLDTIEWTRLDEMGWTYHAMQGSTYTYDTYAHFDDTEDNVYPYSFCDIDETFFTSERITSHSEYQDTTEQASTECTLYEWFTPNFPMCHPNYGGFISPTNVDQPTETAVPDGYLTQLFQNDDYTGIKLVQCPEYTDAIMAEGGTNIVEACHIKNLGVCRDSTSDYCNNGQDYMCPDGWNKKSSGPYTNTINDCESCGSGQVCSASVTSTVCPDGYNCEAMTTDVYSKPGQPGEFLTRDSSGENNDISTCASGYCPGATYSANQGTCPTGYHNNYYTGTDQGQHSMAGCWPSAPGTYGAAQTACSAGYICPPGSETESIQIPAGYYSANTGMVFNGLTVCTAGKWCATGSTAATTNCDAGYYCAAGTIFQYDTPCSFGKTSSAGSSAATDCSACTDGQFCQQGSTAPLTDGSYCGNDNFLCIGGDLKRTTCSSGQHTTDGATCSACPAGQFCTPGLAATDCSAGYESSGSLSSCTLSTAGQVTTGGSNTADATAGQWTIAGQTTEFDCPPGYHCASGVKTLCAAGEVCAQGASAAATAAAGTVGDETGLFYDKPCPAGYTCPAASTRAQATVGTYAIQGTDGSSPTYCNDGYTCAVGSIGPYQAACADGTYYVTGTGSDTCPTCAAGSYCYQAQQITCEAGFYCDIATSPEWHQQCPIGTYSTTGASSVACTECTGGYACNQPGITTDPSAGGNNSYRIAQGFWAITGGTST